MILRQYDAGLGHLEQSVKLEQNDDSGELPPARFALAQALALARRDPTRAQEMATTPRDEYRNLPGKADEPTRIRRTSDIGR